MKIELVTVDMEGTTIDVEEAHHRGHLAASAELGLTITLDEAFSLIPNFIGGPDEVVAEQFVELIKKRTRKDYDAADFLKRTKENYNRILSGLSIELRPGVKEAINWFKEKGYKVAIGSLTSMDQAGLLLEKSGLLKLIGKENIVLKEDVTNSKPDPEVYIKTASLTGVDPKEQLVFEDSPNGIKAAKGAGSSVIAMPVIHKPKTLIRLAEEGYNRQFFDWREINLEPLINNLNQELEVKHL